MQQENARYELSLALRSVLKVIKFALGDDMSKYQKERYDAAEAMLKKHSKITDVLRTESNEQPVEQKENDAVEFAEYCKMLPYDFIRGIGWKDRVTGKEFTTTYLHDEYKKQNKQ